MKIKMYHRVISVICCFSLLFSTSSSAIAMGDNLNKQNGQSQVKTFGDEETTRFIIKFKNESAGENFKNNIKKSMKADTKEVKGTNKDDFYVYTTTSEMKPQDLMTKLNNKNADSDIEYIQPDYTMSVASLEDGLPDTPIDEENKPIEDIIPEENIVPTVPEETDITAPGLIDATINCNIITLTYDEELNMSIVPDVLDYSVVINQGTEDEITASINGVQIISNTVNIALDQAVKSTDEAVVSYAPGINPIQDTAANVSIAYSGQVLTNVTLEEDTTPPEIDKARVDGSVLIITYNEALNEYSVPSIDDFNITINIGTEVEQSSEITDVTVQNNKVIIVLSESVVFGDTVFLSYDPGIDENPIKDNTGNIAVVVSDQEVENITDMEINDPLYDQQWALGSIQIDGSNNTASIVGVNAVDAWQESEGEGVIVAVLDTGIDITHEDLSNNIWTNTAEIPDNGIDEDGNGYDRLHSN